MRIGLKFTIMALAFMLVAAATGGAWGEPATISFDPTQVDELSAGEQFTVDVVIADVSNLYGWQINVTFNPTVLNAVRVGEGPFLKSVNRTMLAKRIDNSLGFVLAGATFVPPNPLTGASGSGILANITFSVKSGGGSNLDFDETMTYFRTFQAPDRVVPIEGVVREDGTYGSGGGGGLPWELVGGIIAVVVVVVVAVVGVFLLRRRREQT